MTQGAVLQSCWNAVSILFNIITHMYMYLSIVLSGNNTWHSLRLLSRSSPQSVGELISINGLYIIVHKCDKSIDTKWKWTWQIYSLKNYHISTECKQNYPHPSHSWSPTRNDHEIMEELAEDTCTCIYVNLILTITILPHKFCIKRILNWQNRYSRICYWIQV